MASDVYQQHLNSPSSSLKVTSERVMFVNHILGELHRVGGVEGYGCGYKEHACISCSPRDPIEMSIQVQPFMVDRKNSKVSSQILLIMFIKGHGNVFGIDASPKYREAGLSYKLETCR